jgi:dolichol-phosphate mannosyltransferase
MASHSNSKLSARPKTTVSVILPSYNERDNIAEAISRVEQTLGSGLLEIIIVDDDSPDRTWEVVEQLDNPKVRLIRRINEQGLASALARGVDESSGQIIAWLDSDLGVPPEVLSKLLGNLDKHDIAIGSRFVKGGEDLRARWIAYSSYVMNFFSRLVLGSTVRDHTSGVIAVKRTVLETIQIHPHGFGEYFIEFVYRSVRHNFKIVEVGYSYTNRASGQSKATISVGVFLYLGIRYATKILVTRFRSLP